MLTILNCFSGQSGTKSRSKSIPSRSRSGRSKDFNGVTPLSSADISSQDSQDTRDEPGPSSGAKSSFLSPSSTQKNKSDATKSGSRTGLGSRSGPSQSGPVKSGSQSRTTPGKSGSQSRSRTHPSGMSQDGGTSNQTEHFGSYDSNKPYAQDPNDKKIEVEVVPVYKDGQPRDRRPGDYPEAEGEGQGDPRDYDPQDPVQRELNRGDRREDDYIPEFDDSLPSRSGDSGTSSRYAGGKKPISQIEKEDRLKKRFILDAVCVAHLSHGHFYTNPKIQCVRKPYNAIKDPFTGKYFENEHMIRLLNKTGQLDYKEPRYRGVAIEGPFEDRAYNIAEFHYYLYHRNKHGCGRAYETYKGIDLYYDLPKPTTRRTFEDEVEMWKRMVIPGYRTDPKDKIMGMQYEDDKVSLRKSSINTGKSSFSRKSSS